jgi:hypothetical protein
MLSLNTGFPNTSLFIEFWTYHATIDKLEPQIEARSNASGLTPPKWLWHLERLVRVAEPPHQVLQAGSVHLPLSQISMAPMQ